VVSRLAIVDYEVRSQSYAELMKIVISPFNRLRWMTFYSKAGLTVARLWGLHWCRLLGRVHERYTEK